jgi:hypothetical protein
MLSAFHAAGLEAWDVNMHDLLAGSVTLDIFRYPNTNLNSKVKPILNHNPKDNPNYFNLTLLLNPTPLS